LVLLSIFVRVGQSAFHTVETNNGSYTNPLIPHQDRPDPGVYVDTTEAIYYVTTTTMNNQQLNKFPILASVDLVAWKQVGYIFTEDTLPIWTIGDFWAPEIHKIEQNFVVYFAARHTTGILCVGVGYSNTTILGPYYDIGYPLIYNSSIGSIDPTYFSDRTSGQGYLFWKEDGNGKIPPEKYSPIWAKKLSPNGLSVTGDKVLILENNISSWEGPLVEAPWIIQPPGCSSYYFLFYSANYVATAHYAVGVARSKNILGPYEKYVNNPILHNNTAWDGPGHCSVVEDAIDPAFYFMIYHAWVHDEISGTYPRLLMMDSILWDSNGWPTINGSSPSITVKPTPPTRW